MISVLIRWAIALALVMHGSVSQSYPIDKYVGFGIGYSWVNATLDEQPREDLGAISTAQYTDIKTQDIGVNIFTGFRFHPYYGVEVGYIYLPEIRFEKLSERRNANDTNPETSLEQGDIRDATVKAQGINLMHVFYAPLSKSVHLTAKLGAIFGEATFVDSETFIEVLVDEDNNEFRQNTPVGTERSSRNLSAFHWSISADWRLTKAWSTRWQIEQVNFEYDHEFEKYTQWYSSLSLQRHF